MKHFAKKIGIMSIVTVFGVVSFAVSVQASTMAVLTPVSVNVTEGQTFDVVVAVNPSGANNYAEKVEIDFPADTLQVKTVALGKNWMALTQDGYNSLDNTKGVLVKTAGYPGGIHVMTDFETITFVTKKTGYGNIAIGASSLAYDVSNQTMITGNQVAYVVSNRSIMGVVDVKNTTPKTMVIPVGNEEKISDVSTSTVSDIVPESQTANVSNTVSLERTGAWVLGAVVLLGLIVYVSHKKEEAEDKNKETKKK